MTNADPEKNSPLTFLGLCLELRLEVYSHMTPAVKDFQHADYQGLYLSCKQIKAEMDDECVKPIKQIIAKLKTSQYYPVHVSIPSVYSQIKNVTISALSEEIERAAVVDIPYYACDFGVLPGCLSPLLELHLDTLAFNVITTNPQRRRSAVNVAMIRDHLYYGFENLLQILYSRHFQQIVKPPESRNRFAQVRCLVVDFGAYKLDAEELRAIRATFNSDIFLQGHPIVKDNWLSHGGTRVHCKLE
ncbi:hypothetical protein K505DRAFT_340451 [Melanomma pulvis-pyrius CBS 109.77]|uniref:Uncharacterized protein n=1 Tax=Melanomma pulvis-pyrius CBS 109.77 TaxID=1314802 RepID=A0A6A6X264_9PLEO|nr:hypothetical protein K505DRAFT_340451 [Melanomma pulvis-pyrius CBS 109.77]